MVFLRDENTLYGKQKHTRGGKKKEPYFSGYKTVFFPFQNNPKYLDPSYKTDLDIWDCFGKGKTDLKAKLHKINLDVWGHSRYCNAPSYKQRNTVPIF